MSEGTARVRARRGHSLQFRLVLLISSILGVMVTIIGAVSIAVQNDILVRRIDEQLAISRGMVVGPDGWVLFDTFPSSPSPNPPGGAEGIGENSPLGAGPGSPRLGSIDVVTTAQGVLYAEAVTDEGEILSLTTDQITELLAASAAASGPITVRLPDLGAYRVLASDLDADLTIIVGQSLKQVNQTTRNLILIFAITALTGVTLASAAATLLVRRELHPLETLRQATSEVSETSLTSGAVALAPRATEPEFSRGTEVGDLAISFNQMMDHLEDSLRQRELSEEKLKRFAADASHELRTPLATVSGYAEFAERQGGDLPDDVSMSLDRIRNESTRMAQIIEDLLLLARLDNGGVRPRSTTWVAPIILEAVADAQVVDPGRTWQVDLPDGSAEWKVPLTDADLRRILANLLSNARAHTPAGTGVRVAAKETADAEVVVEVADYGPGIDSALLPHVFDRFVRGDAARTALGAGQVRSTGLGLAITKELVDAAGGSIGVRSHPGLTVFTLILPLVG